MGPALLPLVRTIPADLQTPLGALLRLRREGGEAFLFESVERGERIGRYSYVGVDPEWTRDLDGPGFARAFRDPAFATPSPRAGDHLAELGLPAQSGQLVFLPPAPAAPPSASPRGGEGDLAASSPRAGDLRDLPRFRGGLVFALGWDYVRTLEPRLGPAEGPVARVALFREVVAFDHLRQRAFLFRTPGEGETRVDAERRLDELERRLDAPLRGVATERSEEDPPDVRASLDCAAFGERVRRAKEYVFAGDVFQVVLSRRFEHPTHATGLGVYRALRMVNPSPYMFYLALGADGRELAGASPEMLLRVEEGEAVTHPIAGTRRRGASETEDERLAAELLADPKERAEHGMLVDLARNDLGRVSAPGTVRLARHMEVERFSHVMHLVSEVRGKLREGVAAADVLDACFPAGTVSGAPKVRAIEIIHELEPTPRGFYAGAVGALAFGGALDACITIRTVEVAPGAAAGDGSRLPRIARYQSGAGVVADSDPAREAEETREKAMALVRAIALAERGLGRGLP